MYVCMYVCMYVDIQNLRQCISSKGRRELDVSPLGLADKLRSGIQLGCQVQYMHHITLDNWMGTEEVSMQLWYNCHIGFNTITITVKVYPSSGILYRITRSLSLGVHVHTYYDMSVRVIWLDIAQVSESKARENTTQVCKSQPYHPLTSAMIDFYYLQVVFASAYTLMAKLSHAYLPLQSTTGSH